MGRNAGGRGNAGSRGSSGSRGSFGGRGSSGGRNAGPSEASSVHETTGAGPSSSKQSDAAPIIEEEAPDDVPTDDEDEILHPEFVIGKVPKGKEAVPEDQDSIPPSI